MVMYGQVVAQRQDGSSSSVISRALAAPLTCLRDLDGAEKWIWPKGKVELWHWLSSRRMRMTKMMMTNVVTGGN